MKRTYKTNQEKTLPETNSSPLKIGGWETILILSLLGLGPFSRAFAVSFREGIRIPEMLPYLKPEIPYLHYLT